MNRSGKTQMAFPSFTEKPTPDGIADARAFLRCGATATQTPVRKPNLQSLREGREKIRAWSERETRLQYAKPHFLVSGMVYNNPLPKPCAHYDL